MPFAVLAAALVVVLPAVEFAPVADGATYLRIADHYAAGRWAEAINAYWSPLLSWLLAPAMAAGVDPVVVFKLVQLAAALATLGLVRSLLRFFGAPPIVMAVVSSLVLGLLVYSASSVVTPDLLLCVPLLGYVRLAVDGRLLTSRPWALATGAVGALAYFAKSIALPVVLAHLVLVLLVRTWNAGSPRARRAAVAGSLVALLGLLVVSAPWVAAISARTGSFTISTAATLNVEWSLPGASGNQQFDPGLVTPPTPNALSVWEDPTVRGAAEGEEALSERGPLEIAAGLAGNLIGNLLPSEASDALQVLRTVGIAGLLLLATVLVFLLRRRSELLLVLGAAGLHGGAVLVTYLEGRYILAPLLLLLVLTGHLVSVLLQRSEAAWALPVPAAALRRPWASWVLVASIAVVAALPFLPRVLDQMAGDHPHPELGRDAAAVLDGEAVASDGYGDDTMWLCVFAGCSWHGMPLAPADAEELRRQLDDHGVDLYLSWTPGVSPAPAGAVRVEGAGGEHFTLYQLR